MENYLNDEVYAENSEEYNEYFSKKMKNRGTETDKMDENMIAKYAKNRYDVSK